MLGLIKKTFGRDFWVYMAGYTVAFTANYFEHSLLICFIGASIFSIFFRATQKP